MSVATPKPWLRFYPNGVRASIAYPRVSLFQLLADTADRFPDKVAIWFYGQEMTYRQLRGAAEQFAAALAESGVARGDRVGIMLPNCPQYVIAYFGTLRLGAVVTQVNPMYVERELEQLLNDCGARNLVALDSLYPRIHNVRALTPLRQVILASLGPPQIPDELGVMAFTDFLARGTPPAPPVEVDADDVAVLQYTGGTTGRSKGAMLTHYNLVANALQVREWFAPLMEEGNERILAALPFFHVYGMTCCLNLAVATGNTAYLVPKYDPSEVLSIIQQHRITLFPGAPTMYVAINNHPRVREFDISSIKACLSGSAPLPGEVQARFEDLTGGRLVEGYGLSEASPVTHCNPLVGLCTTGSIGVGLPDTDVRIVDLETGENDLPAGEVGELVVRGPQVMKGYWNMPDETRATLREGWLYTGDVAYMDEDGYVHIVDRKKDMIITGGMNVYPREVEEVIYQHPKVMECAVAGVPDPYWGEAVKAFVVPRAGQEVTPEEIVEFCRGQLAAYKVPKQVEIRAQLPKTAVGKILRRTLAEEERSRRPSS